MDKFYCTKCSEGDQIVKCELTITGADISLDPFKCPFNDKIKIDWEENFDYESLVEKLNETYGIFSPSNAEDMSIFEELKDKREFGLKKYGDISFQSSETNLDDCDTIQHLKEELIDAENYCIASLIKLDMFKTFNCKNANNIDYKHYKKVLLCFMEATRTVIKEIKHLTDRSE